MVIMKMLMIVFFVSFIIDIEVLDVIFNLICDFLFEYYRLLIDVGDCCLVLGGLV